MARKLKREPMTREQQLEGALQTLVDMCGQVRPFTRTLPMNSVRDVRFAGKFMAAMEKAQALLASKPKAKP